MGILDTSKFQFFLYKKCKHSKTPKTLYIKKFTKSIVSDTGIEPVFPTSGKSSPEH
jgi:hypothetical protein